MKPNAIKSSENPLPGEASSKKGSGNEISHSGNVGNHYDDGEHFEFEFLRIIKIKCKRVSINAIIVIVFVILAILSAWIMFKG